MPKPRLPFARMKLNAAARKSRPPRASTARKLLPVLRPYHNMRDIIKQFVMLEDHLLQPEKRCKDCIRKHFLTIEGLAEECATLCKPRAILPEARNIARQVRVYHHAWEKRPKDGDVAEYIGSRLRKLRKTIMKNYSALPLNKLPSRETDAVNTLLAKIGAAKRAGIKKRRRGNQWKVR